MSAIMKKLIINDAEFELVDETARNAIEQFNDKPYIQYDESSAAELPVHTINDNVTAADSTWSSSKIQNKLDSIDVDVTPVFIPVEYPSSVGIEDKATLEGGCYKLGKIVIVSITATMTKKITRSHYTGNYAVIPEPEHDETPLDGLYVTTNEARYPLITVVRNQGQGLTNVGLVGFNSPDLDLPIGAKIYIGGTYIAASE